MRSLLPLALFLMVLAAQAEKKPVTKLQIGVSVEFVGGRQVCG